MLPDLELVWPDMHYGAAYLKARAEGFRDSSSRPDNPQGLTLHTLPRHLETLNRTPDPQLLPDGKLDLPVPFAHFWLVSGETFVGRVGIRYRLNRWLRRYGGHVGYEIRPSLRRQGDGHAALRYAMAHLKSYGVHNVMVTCNDTNAGSIRIIEAAGAKLEDTVLAPDDAIIPVRRYWFGTAEAEQPWPTAAELRTSVSRRA